MDIFYQISNGNHFYQEVGMNYLNYNPSFIASGKQTTDLMSSQGFCFLFCYQKQGVCHLNLKFSLWAWCFRIEQPVRPLKMG